MNPLLIKSFWNYSLGLSIDFLNCQVIECVLDDFGFQHYSNYDCDLTQHLVPSWCINFKAVRGSIIKLIDL